jgi:extracellular elastinolytic metalloproteinase
VDVGKSSAAPLKGTKRLTLGTLVALVTALGLIGPVAGTAPASTKQVSLDQAIEIAADHARDAASDLGLSRRDVKDLSVTDAYRSSHNGVTHVYLAQKMDGLRVAGSTMTVNISRDGRVVHVGPRFIAGLRPVSRTPILGPSEAASGAAAHLGLPVTGAFRIAEDLGVPDRSVLLTPSGISLSRIPARLLYHPVRDGELHLAWNLEIEEVSKKHWWNISIDARTGRVLSQADYVNHENTDDLEVGGAKGKHDHTRPATLSAPIRPPSRVRDGSSYRVYRLPFESPNDGERTLEKDPADKLGSPYGWHDTEGKKGADHTITKGNNVDAYVDYTGYGNMPNPLVRTEGGESLTFDFEMDEEEKLPQMYRDAAVTNLFYWNNIIHDVLYRYGFNEKAGNFQTNNYGHGGEANDPVRAEAQDHGGVNNANFATPPDGSPSRMQMYLWPSTRHRTILDGDFDSGVIIHEYVHGLSNRLTGGPTQADCLRNQEQAGEGWSDWVAIAMTALPKERGKNPRGMGTWVLGQEDREQKGIRTTPYSTDTAINPSTYKSLGGAAAPHGVGYVFATMLWEVYWNLVDKHGFNPNPYGSWRSGGNNLAIQLVIDGMKFQPCSPGFVDSRDAILAADKALTGGKNRCEIWAGFAKRGLGFKADQKDPANKSDGVEDFSTHPSCR